MDLGSVETRLGFPSIIFMQASSLAVCSPVALHSLHCITFACRAAEPGGRNVQMTHRYLCTDTAWLTIQLYRQVVITFVRQCCSFWSLSAEVTEERWRRVGKDTAMAVSYGLCYWLVSDKFQCCRLLYVMSGQIIHTRTCASVTKQYWLTICYRPKPGR